MRKLAVFYGVAAVVVTTVLVTAVMVTAGMVAAAWWWLGRPVAAGAGAGPGPAQCLSYTPFRDFESPLDAATRASAARIEEDLAKLAKVTGCIRTYGVDNGLDAVPQIAQRLGIKVLQGVWLGRDRRKNRVQIDTVIDLVRRFGSTISAIVVGNEVLLRGELAAGDIAAALAEVKAATGKPVTYADVWEFWLRNGELAAAVDFVTIHILPYWEDFPVAADLAAAHVDAVRARVSAAFPGREILVGEVGWPSAGRMREGALPSPSNQARVLSEVMERARAGNYRVNLIEAFDQPWKRALEGTAGGYWGLFGAARREPKFAVGAPVSDHPWWRWQLALGVALAGCVFAAALAAGGRGLAKAGLPVTAGIAATALVAGVMAPLAAEHVFIESLGPGGFIRGAAFMALSLAAPLAGAMALAAGEAVPGFARLLASPSPRPAGLSFIARLSGLTLLATTVMAIQTALGLVFDPRYRDFTDAQLSCAVVPLAIAAMLGKGAGRGRAETLAAVTLAGSAAFVALNEGPANWQALWFSAVIAALALTLGLAGRDGRSTG